MTALADRPTDSEPHRSGWAVLAAGAAALAVAMGIGRFVYTPILPLMHDQAGLSQSGGATLATANYLGYLIGALIPIVRPALLKSGWLLRGSLLAVIGTLALMPVTQSQPIWFGLRLIAGVASALVFVIAVSALLDNLHGAAQHLVGWAFGGIGAGIALSGLLVLVLRTVGSWRTGWWASAALAALLTVLAWRLAPEPASAKAGPGRMSERPTTHRWFVTLLTGYTLEGVGYIIAGTFLVAAIGQTSPGWLGSGAWVLVGLAAVPASAFWAALSRRWSRPTLLIVMLFVQAVGIALPALSGGAAAALVSAVLFGATFLGVASLVLAVGAHLRFPHAVALLTTGYSLGQIAGPLLVSPLLHNGYRLPLLIAAAIVAAATVAAAALRVRFPHRVGPMVEPSRQARS